MPTMLGYCSGNWAVPVSHLLDLESMLTISIKLTADANIIEAALLSDSLRLCVVSVALGLDLPLFETCRFYNVNRF